MIGEGAIGENAIGELALPVTVIVTLTVSPILTSSVLNVSRVLTASEIITSSVLTPAPITQTQILSALNITTPSYLLVLDVNHLAIVQSTEHGYITTYSNFNFDYSCNFNGKTLFASSKGLFEYGGITDNGTAITASIKTDKSNKIAGQGGMYPTQHRKKISSCKIDINMDKSADALLSVTYNNNTALDYPITNQKDGIEVYHAKIGRGQKGGFNSIQLELSGFDILESIEFDANILPSGRRGNRE